MDDFNKPNVVIPLAASYNTRPEGEGYTQAVTNNVDQKKVNCFYDLNQNEVTGNKSLALLKRPGVSRSSIFGNTNASDDVYYLIQQVDTLITGYGLSSSGAVYATDNLNKRSGISASTSDAPAFVDSTQLSGVNYRVLQTTSRRAFYSEASSSAAWLEISASAFTTISKVGKMEHLDGFAFQMDTLGVIYNSDLNSLAAWQANSKITKTIVQDLGRGLMRHRNLIVAMGSETAEVFYNAGNGTGSPLLRVPSKSFRGVGFNSISRTNYAECLGKTYFVGQTEAVDSNLITADNIGIFAFDGDNFVKVSPRGVDEILHENTNGVRHVQTVNVLGESAVAFLLSMPIDTTAVWLMYFPRVNEWFEWNSILFKPISDGIFFLPQSNSTNLLGRNVYRFRSDYRGMDDVSASYDMVFQFELPKRNNARQSMAWAGVVADSQSAGASASAGAFLQISFSDNDYHSFDTPRQVDLRTRRKQIYRCGSYDDRVVRLAHSGNATCRIQQFIAKTL